MSAENSKSAHAGRKKSNLAHRMTVSEYFRAKAFSWRDVYFREDLSGHVHRSRHSAALALVEKLRLPPRSRVLEVGCGTGRLSVALAKLGFLVTAMDSVPEMLGLAREATASAGVESNVVLAQGDVHSTGLLDGQFDLALAIGVIPWSQRPELAVRELARVTRLGRYVILTADHSWCLHHVLDPRCFPLLRPVRWKLADLLERLEIRSSSRPRYRYFSIREFDAMLSRAGLEKVEGLTVGFGPFSFFNKKLLSNSAELRVHHKLQALADAGLPLIRSAGAEYVVLSRKVDRLTPKEN